MSSTILIVDDEIAGLHTLESILDVQSYHMIIYQR